ncbi:probable serine/threonine-protein kinase At1g54610 [Cucurbita moschata]|uniref:Probable serine/threonine-protein kinase At1g54610 n=1 Tax=Cucurbita moschata TaxID=3662 RepID=A0A6J1HF77_CUCMO|nr:probable serine/threonine-protein kinase At1g54610 [Cucurbita moschata]
MGCVQSRSFEYSPNSGVRKFNPERTYVAGGNRRNTVDTSRSGKVARSSAVVNDGGVRKVVYLETKKEKIGDVGNVSKRISVSENVGGEELVDGWPKWLVENVPREALAGLVPKGADSYDKLAKVGGGTYSNVYKARDRDTGKIVALKKVRFDTSDSDSIKFMAREIMALQKLDHPNVIKLEGIVTSRMPYSLYLVFDFMMSDLTGIISRFSRKLSEAQVKAYMQQLLSGLQHCHERGVLHRDIKPSNLLIDKSGMLKIADFGLANFFIPKRRRPFTNRVVTLWYRAPELLLGSTDYGVGIDLWSAGCLLAEMFLGKPILPGRTEVEQLHKIWKLCGSPPKDYWDKMKLPASFCPPQNYQPGFPEAFSGFSTPSFRLITTLLSLDPARRGTASSALQSEFFSSYPPACELSDLPVIFHKEDEPAKTRSRKKQRSSRKMRSSHSQAHLGSQQVANATKARDSESLKEESSTQPSTYGRGTGSSSSSVSSSIKSFKHVKNMQMSLSPILQSHGKRSPRTEGHPNAIKNIKNPNLLQASTLLQASITDIINPKEGSALTYYQRSISTLDLRSLYLDKQSMHHQTGRE